MKLFSMNGKTNVLMISSVVFIIVAVLVVSHHKNHDKITFQEYVPTYLPHGLSVEKRSIDVRHTPAGNPAYTTTFNLSLSGSSFIYETDKRQSGGYCPTATTCIAMSSPHGQQYSLISIIVGQSLEQTLIWTRGNTSFRAELSGSTRKPYLKDVLDKFIDSFQPVNYKDLQINHYDSSSV